MFLNCRSRVFLFFVANGFAVAYALFIGMVMSPVVLMLARQTTQPGNQDSSALCCDAHSSRSFSLYAAPAAIAASPRRQP